MAKRDDRGPAIVVIGYNRPGAIRRLLLSIERAKIPQGTFLVISIDGGGDPAVLKVAETFDYSSGQKEIITHKRNMGLRNHVLSCGDLSRDLGSVILLEDDLAVSPRFYDYVSRALRYYGEDEQIAGVSLYSHRLNVNARRPFWPLEDGNDVFFLQLPSSWGQAWTREQWVRFRTWQDRAVAGGPLPDFVEGWPRSSWLKRFAAYTVATNTYFVYPRSSLTTNFNDAGTHVRENDFRFQVPLRMDSIEDRFVPLDASYCVYDIFFEIVPDRLRRIAPRLEEYEFDVDLYATKTRRHLKESLVLTTRSRRNALLIFGRQMRPQEMNIIFAVEGDRIALAPQGAVNWSRRSLVDRVLSEQGERKYWNTSGKELDAADLFAEGARIARRIF